MLAASGTRFEVWDAAGQNVVKPIADYDGVLKSETTQTQWIEALQMPFGQRLGGFQHAVAGLKERLHLFP